MDRTKEAISLTGVNERRLDYMTRRQRMLSAIRGEPTDRIPWAPRMDLWYRANKHADTLPTEYRNASLLELLDDLGWTYHAVLPNYKDLRHPRDDEHKAIGIYNLWMMPTKTVLENVDCTVQRRGEETHVEYSTPFGKITTTMVYTEEMLRAGITSNHVSERPIKRVEDYAAIAFIFENARVLPNDSGFQEYVERVGERGIATAYLALAGSPMHLLQHILMPFDLFCYELYDHPDELARCAESIDGHFEDVLQVALRTQAEVYLIGENYDASLTPPPLFKKNIVPWQRRFARALHAHDKLLINHTDGENKGLLDLYLACEFDVADAVCPHPMTKLTLKEVRDHFQGKITIIGGIPSVTLLENSLLDREFEAFLDRLFSELGTGDHLILGVADTAPPGAKFERLKTVARYIEEFGPVNP